ncbi:MAG: M28 family peptidase [Phycisphaerales bacterium JB038]
MIRLAQAGLSRGALALTVLLLSAASLQASPEGRAAAAEVSQANYVDLMDHWLYTHDGHNRGFGVHHNLARNNIQSLFETYGWDVELHPFNYSGSTYYNVVATKQGTTAPDEVYIVGAHYDSVNNPGADDNASGVALILEAARVLGPYDSNATIRLIAFDREEQGLHGSSAYAEDHRFDDIQAAISCDMVAYSPDGEGALIFARYDEDALIAGLSQALLEYGDITPNFAGWTGRTDHAPFDSYGFPAAALTEEYIWTNPHYHSPTDSFDTPGYLNFEFATNMTRAMTGWLVDQAGVEVPVHALEFTYPLGLPEIVEPNGGSRLQVEVAGLGDESPAPNSGRLHYNLGTGWQSAAMEVLGPNLYEAVFPSATCEATIEYYLSADSDSGSTYTDPFNAPVWSHDVLAVSEIITVWADDFEEDLGWTVSGDAVSGHWERGVPNFANHGDPPHDFDGSGQCYLTGNGVYNYDVDGGTTILESPALDLMGLDAHLRYAVWFTNDYQGGLDDEVFQVFISNNDGASWHELQTIGPVTSPAWAQYSFRIADVLPVSPLMRVRFHASDTSWISNVEAAVDAFEVIRYRCSEPCPEDLDGDGAIGQSDLGLLLSAYGLTDAGDIDGDGDTDQADLGALLSAYGEPCP